MISTSIRLCFNPRPRGGGDLCFMSRITFPAVFQSTPPWRGRPRFGGHMIFGPVVSIHAPVEGATRAARVINRMERFQSTPPWRGRRVIRVEGLPPTGVSIHAPVEGATGIHTRLNNIDTSFNPRPRGGGDIISPFSKLCFTCFNPRPRGGGDRYRRLRGNLGHQFQSTPPWRGRQETQQ